MKNFFSKYIFNTGNLFFLLIFLSFLLPSRYAVEMRAGVKNPLAFAILLGIIEVFFLFSLRRNNKRQATKDIGAFVFILFFIWELTVTRFNLLPYIFIPAPENVFYVFIADYKAILKGLWASLFLIISGLVISTFAAVFLGTLVGWNKRLTQAVYPVAKVFSTVPPLIYTPYVVLIMPTFKLASLTVIFLSIFWGTFMGAINNTAFVEKKIVNSAKVLNLSTSTILFKIIIPFNMPRIINAIPIHLSSALITLTAAELIGADSGMGYYVRIALNFANYDKAIAGIFFIGLVVTFLNGLVNLLKRKLIKWNY